MNNMKDYLKIVILSEGMTLFITGMMNIIICGLGEVFPPIMYLIISVITLIAIPIGMLFIYIIYKWMK
jgi:hypothetical protein